MPVHAYFDRKMKQKIHRKIAKTGIMIWFPMVNRYLGYIEQLPIPATVKHDYLQIDYSLLQIPDKNRFQMVNLLINSVHIERVCQLDAYGGYQQTYQYEYEGDP